MLTALSIRNVALIESAEIEFGEGLNVLSGETGSGKSVILDSINFVLGAKADRSMIRHGAGDCSVTAVFWVPQSGPALDELRAMDIDAEGEIVISRRYRADGRGDSKINGCSVSAGMLRRVTAHLVDVHGQSEHFYLLSESNQLALLDRAAGEAVARPKAELSRLLAERRDIAAKRAALGGDDAERGRRLDILRYQMDEIDRAAVAEGEEASLEAKKLFYANIEKIGRALAEAAQALTEDGAAVDGLHTARRSLAEISRLDAQYASLCERLESVAAEAEDIGETVSSLAEDLSYDEQDAEETENRLDLIRSLKKKYGGSISAVVACREKIGQEYDLLSHSDEQAAKLAAAAEKNGAAVYAVCREITEARKAAADAFCARVTEQLKTLNIKSARFGAEFAAYGAQDAPRATAEGLDSMRFLFSANAGEPFKPLNKVISGGEMSRLMLAIKTCMSGGGISTYIFDEIDAGISGRTAKVVAEKFAAIARDTQIIAVSHLAQIAAMADQNFLISKRETPDGKTRTDIAALDEEGRKQEIVRLLGGEGSGAAAKLADELLDSCAAYKAKMRAFAPGGSVA